MKVRHELEQQLIFLLNLFSGDFNLFYGHKELLMYL